MSDFVAWPGDGGSIKLGLTTNRDNLLLARECHRSVSPPSTPIDGMLWAEDGGGGDDILQYRDGAGTWRDVVLHKLEGDLNCNKFQLDDARLENLATLPAAGASRLGQPIFHTGQDRVIIVRTSDYIALAHFPVDDAGAGTKYIDERISLEDCLNGPGTNPAKVVHAGRQGLEFVLNTEIIQGDVRVPDGWDGKSDPLFHIEALAMEVNAAGDDADWKLIWSNIAEGELYDKAAQETVTIAEDQPGGNADKELMIVEMPINWDVGTPDNLAVGEYLRWTLSRNGLATIGSMLVVGLRIRFPAVNASF